MKPLASFGGFAPRIHPLDPNVFRSATMPSPAYMSIEGVAQGNITAGANTADSMGNRYQEGHEDEITVQGFKHEIIIPRDPQSGQPSGQRVHQPLIITKIYDKSSPLLYNALASGERLSKVEIKWVPYFHGRHPRALLYACAGGCNDSRHPRP
jgi:hypothetical protein